MKSFPLSLALFAAVCLSAQAATYSFQTSENRSDLNSNVWNAAAVPESLAVGDVIDLSLPGGAAFSLELVSAPPAGIAGQSFIACDRRSEAAAVVKPKANGIRIIIDDYTNSRIFTVRVKDGAVSCSVHDTSSDPADTCATCGETVTQPEPAPTPTQTSTVKTTKSKPRLGSAVAFPLASHPAVIDVLVAFDQGAKAWAANSWVNEEWRDEGTIQEFADYAVDKMNIVLTKSQLNDRFSFRLVGVAEVDATYTAINNSVLLSLQAGGGDFAKVAALREKCGADTTTLLVNRTSGITSGVGFPLQSTNENAFAAFAAANKNCNVCDIKTVDERYTMSHETGHNMGCGHSNTQGSNSGPEPGPFPYSCGYHFIDANNIRRHTVMAYNYDGSGNGDYKSIPYFSSPDLSPVEYGVPLGKAGTNDNRQVLIHTHQGVSTYREHVVPYDWDVRFVDSNGKDIPDGAYFAPPMYVTLTNSNPNAVIYYAYDGETPTSASASGTQILLQGTRTITACAVVGGVAQLMRTVTFINGLEWSGESGRNGNGVWKSGDSSVRAWNNSSHYFLHGYDTIRFPDIDGNDAPTVTVNGLVAPTGASFMNYTIAYTFEKGTADALIHLCDASFAPSGDLTFNVPVQFDAVAFTNPANHSLTFNAPFGQMVSATSGYCTNAIGIGAYGTLTISPGGGNTQTFDHFSNGSWFYSNARINVGSGTVVFKGPASDKGLYGSPQFNVARDANVILDMTSSAYDPFCSTSKVSGEGTITYKAVLPSNSSRWTSTDWKGTVAFEGLAADNSTKDFQFENYGNANSKILLRNCTIFYLKNNNATFAGTVVLDGDSALTIRDGYSNNYSVFGALEGSGTMTFLEKPMQWYVFNTATNFTGSINVQHGWYGGNVAQGRRVVFGATASTSDLPTQSASITVKSGAEAAIGANATWYAYHGVEIAGTLIVKGANATLSCHSAGAMGVKLTGGATLRFDSVNAALSCLTNFSFSSGTVNVAFAPGISPSDRQVLVQWLDTGSVPAGNFTFANAALNSTWELSKTSTGLVVKTKNRYDVSGTGSYIAYDSALESWLDDENFWMYEDEMTWQEFMEERGVNGYLNWQNYILGFSASDPLAKVKAKISFDSLGNVVVSVADSIPRAPTVPGFTVSCKLLQTNDLKNWPSEGTSMGGKTATVPVDAGNVFYKVLIELN